MKRSITLASKEITGKGKRIRLEDIDGADDLVGGAGPPLTKGQLISADAAGTKTALPVGTSGQVLTADPAQPLGLRYSSAAGLPALAKGQLVSADAGGTPTALAAGADGQFLVADSAETLGIKYAVPPTGVPPLSKGQIVSADAGGTPTALAVGADGQLLVADSGQPLGLNYVVPPTGVPTLAKGEIVSADAGGTPTAFSAIPNDEMLVGDSTQPLGLASKPRVPPGYTKGDLLTTDDGSVVLRLPLGADGNVLTANSALTGGLEWTPISTESPEVYNNKFVKSLGTGTADVTVWNVQFNNDGRYRVEMKLVSTNHLAPSKWLRITRVINRTSDGVLAVELSETEQNGPTDFTFPDQSGINVFTVHTNEDAAQAQDFTIDVTVFRTGPGDTTFDVSEAVPIAPDAPSLLPNLLNWFDASDSLVTTGSDIDQWTDKGPNMSHFTGSGATRPTLSGSSPETAVFNKANNSLLTNVGFSDWNGLSVGMTLIVILKRNSNSSGVLIGNTDAFSPGLIMFFNQFSGNALYYQTNNLAQQGGVGGGDNPTDGVMTFTCFSLNLSGAGHTYYTRNNPVSGLAGTLSTLAPVGTQAIGGGTFPGTLDGEIAEIVVYDKRLLDAEIVDLRDNYFTPKWSLTHT